MKSDVTLSKSTQNYIRMELIKRSHQLFGRSVFVHGRKRDNVFHRHNVIYVLHRELNRGAVQRASLDDIAFMVSDGHIWDHATVIHARRTVEDEMEMYKDRKISIDFWTNIVREILLIEKRANQHLIDFMDGLEKRIELSDYDRLCINEILYLL